MLDYDYWNEDNHSWTSDAEPDSWEEHYGSGASYPSVYDINVPSDYLNDWS